MEMIYNQYRAKPQSESLYVLLEIQPEHTFVIKNEIRYVGARRRKYMCISLLKEIRCKFRLRSSFQCILRSLVAWVTKSVK